MHTMTASRLALLALLLGSAARAEQLPCSGEEEDGACSAAARSLLQRAHVPRVATEATAGAEEEAVRTEKEEVAKEEVAKEEVGEDTEREQEMDDAEMDGDDEEDGPHGDDAVAKLLEEKAYAGGERRRRRGDPCEVPDGQGKDISRRRRNRRRWTRRRRCPNEDGSARKWTPPTPAPTPVPKTATERFMDACSGDWGSLKQRPRDLVRDESRTKTVGGTRYGPTSDGDSRGKIGGGVGYQRFPSRTGAKTVRNVAEFESALSSAGNGDVIWIDNDLNLGDKAFNIGKEITIAGNRGQNGAKGPLLDFSGGGHGRKVTGFYVRALVRFTGLRIKGPWAGALEPTDWKTVKYNHKSIGIMLRRASEVDNCELFSWSHAAIMVDHGDIAVKSHVHHCHIHDTQAEGHGYGVTTRKGIVRVEWSQFERNRHAVAASGGDTNAWEANNNYFFGPNIHSALDMHGPKGYYFQMWNNWVESGFFFQVRGQVKDNSKVEIKDNWFAGTNDDNHLGPRSAYGSSWSGYRSRATCNIYGSGAKEIGKSC